MKPKILIVEDEIALLATLQEFLVIEYDVVKAQSGERAVTLIKELKFDAAIVDLNLPDTHGLNIIKLVKNRQPKAAILVLTGDGDSDTVKKALDFGAMDYLLKPISKLQLLRRLKHAVHTRKSDL